jgi:MFS family permease
MRRYVEVVSVTIVRSPVTTASPAPATVSPAVGSFAPLRYGPYRTLVTGRMINMLGSSIAGLALGFAVLDLNGSLSDVGYIVAVRTVLNVVFVLFGGVVADRLPRNLLMVGAAVLAGVSQATAATLFLTHTATMPVLLVLAAINGMAAALSQPASAAIMPQTIPSHLRKQANALFRLASNTIGIASLGIAGTLVAVIGSGWCVAFDAATFFIAAVFFALTRVPRVADAVAATAEKRPGIVASLREGWREFIGHTWLWVVVVGFMLFNAAISGGIGVLGLHFADITVGRRLWSVVLAAETVGGIAGAFVAMRVRVPRFLAYGVATVGTGALLPLALVFSPNFFVLLAASFIGGVGMEQFGIAWETTMQENIEPDMLARVYSYDMLGSWVAMPIGQLAVGPAAAAFGARGAMLAVAIAMLIATVGMLASRSVRQLRHVVVRTEDQVAEPVLVPLPGAGEPEQVLSP